MGEFTVLIVIALGVIWFLVWRWQQSENRKYFLGEGQRAQSTDPIGENLKAGNYAEANRLAEKLLADAQSVVPDGTDGATIVDFALVSCFAARSSVGDANGARAAEEAASANLTRVLKSPFYRDDRDTTAALTALRNGLDRELAKNPLDPKSIRDWYLTGAGE